MPTNQKHEVSTSGCVVMCSAEILTVPREDKVAGADESFNACHVFPVQQHQAHRLVHFRI
jgi:hypothetical protein